MSLTVPLTREQARYLHAKLAAYQAAEAAARDVLGILTAGHAPEGSTFVSVNTETGELIVEPPMFNLEPPA